MTDRGTKTVAVLGLVAMTMTLGTAAAPLTFPLVEGPAPGTEASRLATAAGARMVRCRCPMDGSWRPRTVTVIVEIGVEVPIFGDRTVRAAAAAEFDPSLWLTG